MGNNYYDGLFKMPNQVKITRRISSVTNAFVNGIIPIIKPTREEVTKALEDLGMNDEKGIRCAYCGGKYSEWDHFHPIVKDGKPSGFISEINNLVPCCSSCNSKKRNKDWREYMDKVQDNDGQKERRMELLEKYEGKRRRKISENEFKRICGEEDWAEHWINHDKLVEQMKNYQACSDRLMKKLQDEYCPHIETGVKSKETSSPSEAGTEIKIGQYVQNRMCPVLKRLPDAEVAQLLSMDYSRSTFTMGYPILSNTRDPQERYYAKPVQIGDNLYYLCSQWSDRHWKKLKVWMDKWE